MCIDAVQRGHLNHALDELLHAEGRCPGARGWVQHGLLRALEGDLAVGQSSAWRRPRLDSDTMVLWYNYTSDTVEDKSRGDRKRYAGILHCLSKSVGDEDVGDSTDWRVESYIIAKRKSEWYT
jgi:hypothetical protein